MGRSPSCDEKYELKKGPWTPEEDQKLVDCIQKHGLGSWSAFPKLAGLNRCGKSCRLRWTNYLRPDIKRGKFSQEEEQTILHFHSILGNKWSAIATHLPGRTDNEIKNFWNTHLKKKLIQMGFDPMTHQPRTDLFANLPHLIAMANLRDLINQPSLEADQLANLQYLQHLLQFADSSSVTSSPYSQNSITDHIDALSLWNSISPLRQNPVLNSSYSTQVLQNQALFSIENATSSQPLHHNNPIITSLNFPESDPQVPFSFQTPLNSDINTAMISHEDDKPPNSPWLLPSPTSSGTLPISEVSISNPGDGCSVSSYGGGGASSSCWTELLFEEPFMHEIS
ncbi:hypothetical protein ACSBR2_029495 [Camellia fascicularis]